MRKSVKKALTFEAFSSRFWDLHFWNPLAICENLASTKKMGIFSIWRVASGPMCVTMVEILDKVDIARYIGYFDKMLMLIWRMWECWMRKWNGVEILRQTWETQVFNCRLASVPRRTRHRQQQNSNLHFVIYVRSIILDHTSMFGLINLFTIQFFTTFNWTGGTRLV